MSANTTFGASVGKFIGNTAAYAVHGALSASQYTGQFGRDVAAGTTEAYAAKSAELEAKRNELRVGQAKVAVKVVRRTAKA